MGMQLILPVIVPVKKIKSSARQCYGDGDEVGRCEQVVRMLAKVIVQREATQTSLLLKDSIFL